MMRRGCVTTIRRMLTLSRFGAKAVGGMKDAHMAEPDSRVAGSVSPFARNGLIAIYFLKQT